MQVNSGSDNFYEGPKNFSRESYWISSTEQFGPILEKFGSYAIEFWLGHILGKFWTFFKRCNWISAETQMGVVLEVSR